MWASLPIINGVHSAAESIAAATCPVHGATSACCGRATNVVHEHVHVPQGRVAFLMNASLALSTPLAVIALAPG